MNEEVLVRQMKEGDKASFDLLYDKYKNMALRTAYLITGSLPDSEDVVQDTFVKVYLHCKELKNDSGFKAWMMQILVRSAYKAGKRKSRELPDDEVVEKADRRTDQSSLEQLLVKEEARMLSDAVRRLPVKQRTAVILFYYQECPVSEIARMLGCREGTVKSRLHMARKRLRGMLEADPGDAKCGRDRVLEVHMYKYDFEQNIKSALETECRDIAASRSLKERIDDEIMNSQKEAETMKHLSAKRLAIGVAAACLLMGGGAYAAGHAVTLSSHHMIWDTYRSYDDMDKAEEELGCSVDSVEEFSNGYQFSDVYVEDVDAWDEDGNNVYTYPEMTIDYTKDGESGMYLAIHKPMEAVERDKEADATRTCGDITLYYDEYTYKFVPPSYELTEEDRENQEQGGYYISYGSLEVEIRQSQGVTWEKDGLYYNLAGFDLNLSAEEMLDMAEEMIGQE